MKKHFTIFIFLVLVLQITSAQNNFSFNCGPIPALCSPGHVFTPQGNLSVGIHNIHFGQINHTTIDTAGYQDYTCTDSTILIQGNVYQFTATTGQTYEECVRAWIDFNNDGAFDTTEIIFNDSAIVFIHIGLVTMPVIGQINTPLRMRVASDYSIYPPVNACLPVQYGNYMDFTIYFDGPDAVSDIKEKSAISVFPNPFTEEAQINFGTALSGIKSCTLNIYDITGSLMRQEKIETVSFNIHRKDLPKGMYYFFLYSESKLLGTEKIIIY